MSKSLGFGYDHELFIDDYIHGKIFYEYNYQHSNVLMAKGKVDELVRARKINVPQTYKNVF